MGRTWVQLGYIAAVLVAKFLLATTRRSFYPYASQLATHVGNATTEEMSFAIGSMNIAYSLAPIAVPALLATAGARRTLLWERSAVARQRC